MLQILSFNSQNVPNSLFQFQNVPYFLILKPRFPKCSHSIHKMLRSPWCNDQYAVGQPNCLLKINTFALRSAAFYAISSPSSIYDILCVFHRVVIHHVCKYRLLNANASSIRFAVEPRRGSYLLPQTIDNPQDQIAWHT